MHVIKSEIHDLLQRNQVHLLQPGLITFIKYVSCALFYQVCCVHLIKLCFQTLIWLHIKLPSYCLLYCHNLFYSRPNVTCVMQMTAVNKIIQISEYFQKILVLFTDLFYALQCTYKLQYFWFYNFSLFLSFKIINVNCYL